MGGRARVRRVTAAAIAVSSERPAVIHRAAVVHRTAVIEGAGGDVENAVRGGLQDRDRRWWPALETRWSPLARLLDARESVDLMLLPHSATRCEVRSRTRGTAFVSRLGYAYRYERGTGDPLGVGADIAGSADETYDALRDGAYPDAIVQISNLAGSARAGDIILSATPGWDFRARYEPIPHRSAHGALHRDHMLVPLLTNRPPARMPRRTTDIFPSTLAALGIPAPPALDGASFL